MSIITFIFYFVDKRKAIKNKWRIKENTLVALTFFGGALGASLAMFLLRHKTRHLKFKIINLACLIMQIYVGTKL